MGFDLCFRLFHGLYLTTSLQAVWCAACKKALAWSLMTDAESPATPFELLYLFFPVLRRRVVYDNSCHLLDYSLNRLPEWTELMQPLIDAFHANGHTSCAQSLNTGTACLPRVTFACCP